MIGSERARLSSIRLRVPDSDDEQVWVQSSIANTHKLPRGTKEDFSITQDALTLITNRGGGIATLSLECLSCAESGIFVGSNRRAGAMMREGQSIKLRMRAGEVLSVRSLDACEPVGKHDNGEGGRIAIRPGQSVVV